MAGPDTIMIIRHAEKPDAAAPVGVDEDGSPDKHSLTIRGWQRAGALVPFFASPARPGIARPATIVAATRDRDDGTGDNAGSRPQETVAPLRARIGGDYWDDIAVGAEAELVEKLKAHAGVILVAWEHKRIHHIVAGFIDSLAPEWDSTRFDAVWILDRSPAGPYRLTMLNQDLLAGDAPA
jgi:hypothetical protein